MGLKLSGRKSRRQSLRLYAYYLSVSDATQDACVGGPTWGKMPVL